jgi:hypothetical protein
VEKSYQKSHCPSVVGRAYRNLGSRTGVLEMLVEVCLSVHILTDSLGDKMDADQDAFFMTAADVLE